jgi:phosphatidylethanolamine-binding protein (PEBP) family uncharacterized protein
MRRPDSVASHPVRAPHDRADLARLPRRRHHPRPQLLDGPRPQLCPALAWTGVPDGTRRLLFVLEDIDVPMSRPVLHTIALIDPAVSALGEGEMKPGHPSIRFIPAQRGNQRYFGPRPLPGHGVHQYGFHLYALDRALPDPLTGMADVLTAAAGHVLADGFLEGVKVG